MKNLKIKIKNDNSKCKTGKF